MEGGSLQEKGNQLLHHNFWRQVAEIIPGQFSISPLLSPNIGIHSNGIDLLSSAQDSIWSQNSPIAFVCNPPNQHIFLLLPRPIPSGTTNVSRTTPTEGTCRGRKKKKMKKVKFPRSPRRRASQGRLGEGKWLQEVAKRNCWSFWSKKESLRKPRRRKPNQLSELERFSTPGVDLRPRDAQCPSLCCPLPLQSSRNHKPVEVRGRC